MKLTHTDGNGKAKMVSIGDKRPTFRTAIATSSILMKESTLELIKSNTAVKGDVLTVAKIAAINAAKQCGSLIPLCHNINLDCVEVEFELADEGVKICSFVSAEAKTGVEMEALIAASTAALTIYDMVKAVDRGMIITQVKLLEKHGGKSGDFVRKEE